METDQKTSSASQTKNYLLPASILIAAVLISGSVIYSTGAKGGSNDSSNSNPNTPEAVSPKISSADVILGDPKAPITMIEYSDFQCPFCGRFYSQTEPSLKEQYIKTDKVHFIYRHFAFLGPESKAAAEAVECAKDQSKFWEYHDAIFNAELADGRENNGNLNRALFLTNAENLGLNLASFKACLDSNKYGQKVADDYSGAQALGVKATPTVFVNEVKIEGALPFGQFQQVIEQLLANQ